MFENFKIRTKAITIFCLIIICTILIVSCVGFFIAKKSIKNIRLETLESIADLKADAIDKFFQEKIANMKTSQDYYNIKHNLPTLIQLKNDKTNPAYIQAKNMLDGQLKTFQKIYGYLDVMLTDKDGNIVYVSNESHIGSDLGRNLYNNYDKNTLKEVTKGIYISQVFLNTIEDQDYEMMIMASIYDFNKTFIGVIVLEVNMEPVYELIQDTTGLGDTGETLIVSNNKSDATILNHLRHDQDAALKRIVTIEDGNRYTVREALNGRKGTGQSVDYRGKDIIAAWQHIALLDWGLIAKVDTSEAFAPITKLKQNIFFVALIILGVAVILAIIISNSITGPIKKLSDITHKINSGNLEIRAEIESKDEIGMLAKSFNTMTDCLVATRIEEGLRSKQLEQFNANLELLLYSIPSIIIELSNDYKVLRLNHSAEYNFGICESDVVNQLFRECNIEWDWDKILNAVSLCKETKNSTWIDNFKYKKIDTKEGSLGITINPLIDSTGNQSGILILMSDITERKEMEHQLLRSQKLESIGHLAAGIAHEINTPTQYIMDNTNFLKDAFSNINKLLEKYSQLYEMSKSGSVTSELTAEIDVIAGNADVDYLIEEIPNAINQSLEGWIG
jgi:PAS domain S-box